MLASQTERSKKNPKKQGEEKHITQQDRKILTLYLNFTVEMGIFASG